jgi:hypothetical protein
MKTIKLTSFLFFLVMTACRKPGSYYSSAAFPETPVNMGNINSEYDDYNSASPFVGTTFPLCFSTNRKSRGADFDIIYKMLDVNFSTDDGKVTVAENESYILSDFSIENKNLGDAMLLINVHTSATT